MKKGTLFFLALASITVTSCNVQASNKGRLTEPFTEKATPTPSCLKMMFQSCCCFSCCNCKESTAERAATIATEVGSTVNTILGNILPPGILQIYLLCTNAAYYGSMGIMMYLQHFGLLDERGRLKPDAKKIFLEKIEWMSDPETKYKESVRDLSLRFPKIIARLKGQQHSRNRYNTSDMITSKLFTEYELIASPTNISPEEINAILATAATMATKDIGCHKKSYWYSFKLACCCCCTDIKKSPTNTIKTAARNKALSTLFGKLNTNTHESILRALYLYCMDNNYKFSPAVQDFLDDSEYALVDAFGSIQPEDQAIIKKLLQPNATVLDPDDWYFQQRVTDFAANFPELATEFTAQRIAPTMLRTTHWYSAKRGYDLTDRGNIPHTNNALQVLYDNYRLIAAQNNITDREIAAIQAAISVDVESLMFALKVS